MTPVHPMPAGPPDRWRLAPLALVLALSLGCPEEDPSADTEITAVSPSEGSVRGGETVALVGYGLEGVSSVTFGEWEAEVVQDDGGEVIVRSPAATRAGTVPVTIHASGGTSTWADGFTYLPLPLSFVDVSLQALLPDAAARARIGALADLDGDGDLDYAQAEEAGLTLFANDGGGTLERVAGEPVLDGVTDYVNQVLVGDLDGDGDLDLYLVTAMEAADLLLIHDGALGFAASEGLPAVPTHGVNGALGDLDADGDLDVVVVGAEWGGDPGSDPLVSVWINDGAGGFADEGPQRLPEVDWGARGLAAGDVDGDGALDLFFTADTGALRLLLGDGQGHFLDAPPDALPGIVDPHGRVPAMGDLDGDGAPDLVVPAVGQDRVLINDGSGRFVDDTDYLLGPEDASTYTATLADLDGDGSLDALLSDYGAALRLLRNDGTGRLFDYSASFAGNGGGVRPLTVLPGDLDGDGDLDLVVPRLGGRRPLVLRHWDPEPADDADGDGVPDGADGCPDVADPDQADTDAHHFSCDGVPGCSDATGCDLAIAPGGSAYLLCGDAAVGFDAARAACQARGADLVVIEDADENAFLLAQGVEEAWIGLSDTEKEGVFLWVDGSAPAYENWNEGEPNDSGGNEDCGQMRLEGMWNDVPCDTALGYVCEDVVLRSPRDLPDACDNCPEVINLDQADSDQNGVGDACEPG